MKRKTFFEKFDQFADAPDAVAKMRELVRNFAVTGKLVLQDPNEEPAEVLTARIAAALPNKKSENPFLEEIECSVRDESEYELPPGWAWLPLGHVGIWATGCGFPMQYQGETHGDFLFCKVSDMNLPGNEVEIHTTVHSIDAEVMRTIRARVNPAGTVIFPKIGGAIATHKRRLVIKPTIIDNNCSGIQPIGLTDERWLLLLMRTLDLTKYQSGTSVPAVSQGSLDPIRIGLPPLAEQKRIVAKVAELMELCDRLEAQHQERDTRHAALARASLARFADAPTPVSLPFLFHPSYVISPADLRKSVLTLAVQGKLVPQDPNDEPADEILKGIARDVATAIQAKRMRNSRLISAYDGEFPFELPVGWVWAQLGALTAAEDGAMCDGPFGSRLKTEHYISTTGYAVLRLGNIGVGHFIHGKEGHISREHFESLSSNHTAPGDLLVAGLAEPLVRCCEIPSNMGPAVNKSDCFRLRLSKRMDRSYVRHYLNSPIAKTFAAEENHGMTRERINLASAKALPVSVPPLAEQRRIVAKVDQLMALVAELETQLVASRATAANLLTASIAELTT